MKILLKSATVLERNSPFHTKTVDIFIENGKIKDISNIINSSAEIVISKKNYMYQLDGLILVFALENLVLKTESQ